jgi:hypothetical protein
MARGPAALRGIAFTRGGSVQLPPDESRVVVRTLIEVAET